MTEMYVRETKKSIVKYPHLLLSGKRGTKQNIMNLKRLKIFV